MLGSYWNISKCTCHISFENNLVSPCLNDKLEKSLKTIISQFFLSLWDLIVDRLTSKIKKMRNPSHLLLCFSSNSNKGLINNWFYFSISKTRFITRFLVRFLSMTIVCFSADAKLSDKMILLTCYELLNFVPKQKTIGRYISKPPE